MCPILALRGSGLQVSTALKAYLPTERACDHSKLKELQKLCRPESPVSSLLSAAALHSSEKCQGEKVKHQQTLSLKCKAGVTETQPIVRK